VKYIVVVGDEAKYCAIYETDSEDEVEILQDVGVAYVAPANWDRLSQSFWGAYTRAVNCSTIDEAKRHFLARVARRVEEG
jgi:hypothetical protein